MTTVLEQVRSLIVRLSPDPICDDCIAEKLGLSVRQHANHKTREFVGKHGFERARAIRVLRRHEEGHSAKVVLA